jgi:replicative DNA helicase
MPSVYSLQEALRSGEDTVLADHPDRMRAPWSSLDAMVNIMPGDVVGINATNSGMGKTTFVLQWTLYNAIKYGRTFLNFQVEMRPSEIATMVAAQVLRKDRNFLTSSDKKEAAKQLEGVAYYIGHDPVLTDINAVLDLLEAAIKRLSPYGCVLDHFHHLSAGMDNETKMQSAAMTRIKQIAETYKVVFLNVGQPRKATQQTKSKQIHLTDAKGSGAWADASNAVVTMHRDLNKSDDPTLAKGVYEDKTLVKLLKGRSMGTGASAAYITSFGEFASFEELDQVHEEQEN